MKNKILFESTLSVLFVFVGTYFVYGYLKPVTYFWDAQNIWSLILAIGWTVVSLGYYHQGWLIHKSHDTSNVSIVLPIAVFFIQCILFIKGVHYSDWSLIWGAMIVNSGVSFSIYHIIKYRKR